MRSLSDNVKAIESASPQDWPFRVADLGRELEAELGDPDVLLEIVHKFLTVAQDQGCHSVAGASRVGGQIAGAIVARATTGLRLFTTTNPADSVLVVDGMLATGTHIARAVRAAKDGGAKRVVAAAVLGSHEALEFRRDDLGEDLVVLEEF